MYVRLVVRPRKSKLAADFPSRMSNLAADDEAEAIFDRSFKCVCGTARLQGRLINVEGRVFRVFWSRHVDGPMWRIQKVLFA